MNLLGQGRGWAGEGGLHMRGAVYHGWQGETEGRKGGYRLKIFRQRVLCYNDERVGSEGRDRGYATYGGVEDRI